MPPDHRPAARLEAKLSRREVFQALAGGLSLLFAAPALSRKAAALAEPRRLRSADTLPAYVAVLQPQLEQLLQELLVPAAAVMVRSPELGDWSMTFGTRTLGGTQPATLEDHVRIGSNTKTMTGTVILQLVEEGQLGLDDPVSTYRPDTPNGDQISIAQLLSMRSGLSNYSESLELNRALDDTPTRVWSPDELLAIAFQQPPLFAPGARYFYSNTNYILLGVIIEQLTGDSASAAFQERIFGPLGLTETELPVLSSNAIPLPHPQGYMFGTNVGTIASQTLPEEQQALAAAGLLLPTDVTDENPSWGWTAGSGISTTGDLVQYVQALVAGGLLSSTMQAQRLGSIQPTNPADPGGTGYGLGLAKLGPMYGHTGELPGYNSFMGYDPQRDLTIVTWTSLAAAPDGRAPATELAKAIIGQLYGGAPGVQAPSR